MCTCALDKERFSLWHWPRVHPFEAAQYFDPAYLLTHGLCFKEEKDVNLETGKRIVIYSEVALQRW